MAKSYYGKKTGITKFIDILYPEEQSSIQTVANDTVILSHLRWDSVTQRPHHIAMHLAQDRSILFIEEPIFPHKDEYRPYHLYRPSPNITVVQPFSTQATDDYDYAALINKFIDTTAFSTAPIMWLYSPMFVDCLHYVDPSLVVYDNMDKLSSFKFAPATLAIKEQMLLTLADVVFTGGKSLYEDMNNKHTNAYCFPSSVDIEHFSKAVDPETIFPHDILEIPQPRVGYFGVIDERMDLKMVKETAQRLPQVSFLYIGPVVKISETDLPRLKNIHYLGPRDYQILPNYLKGIDVTFMPFAQNEATRYISPTKTLEFMAAEKGIVATPIRDVVRDYSHVISIVDSSKKAADALLDLLNENATEKTTRIARQKEILSKTSWKKTVKKMKEIMDVAMTQKTDIEDEFTGSTVFKLKLT